MTHFELISVHGERQGSNFILVHVDIQIFQYHMLKKPFFCTLVENLLTINVCFSSGLSIPTARLL